MKGMYKDGEYRVAHTYEIEDLKAKGWTFEQKAKEDNLTDTHKKALELGIEIKKEDGTLIHHKTLAKEIKAKEDGDKD